MKKKNKIIFCVVLLLVLISSIGLYFFKEVDLCVIKFSLKNIDESNIYCMDCQGEPDQTNTGVTAQRCGMWSLRDLNAILID